MTGVVLLLMGVVALVSGRANDHYRVSRARLHLNNLASTTIDRVCDELAYAERDDLNPVPATPFGSSWIEYEKSGGYGADGSVWQPTARLALELVEGEVDDGLDNNGNGLVDEGQLVMTRDVGLPSERRVVICKGIQEYLGGETPNGLDDNGNGLEDERGFSLVLEGEMLTVRLSVANVDHQRRMQTVTHETSILIRN